MEVGSLISSEVFAGHIVLRDFPRVNLMHVRVGPLSSTPLITRLEVTGLPRPSSSTLSPLWLRQRPTVPEYHPPGHLSPARFPSPWPPTTRNVRISSPSCMFMTIVVHVGRQ